VKVSLLPTNDKAESLDRTDQEGAGAGPGPQWAMGLLFSPLSKELVTVTVFVPVLYDREIPPVCASPQTKILKYHCGMALGGGPELVGDLLVWIVSLPPALWARSGG